MRANHGSLSLSPFQTLRNNAEGEAYARDHGEDYPFSNDYYDAPIGARHTLELAPGTVCTGIIQVDYREALEDHIVTCEELVRVAKRTPLPVAVWLSDGEVTQASELYRP